jgi:hypothetical protein
MFGDPKECREHARQCFESARSASTLAMMARFEGLAHSWLRLAEDIERAEALLERLKEPEPIWKPARRSAFGAEEAAVRAL